MLFRSGKFGFFGEKEGKIDGGVLVDFELWTGIQNPSDVSPNMTSSRVERVGFSQIYVTDARTHQTRAGSSSSHTCNLIGQRSDAAKHQKLVKQNK